MTPLYQAFRQMICISEVEYKAFLDQCAFKGFRKNEILSKPGTIPQEIFFIEKGIIRVVITDQEGLEHTLHFALENQFIADYSCFLLKTPALYTLQALEDTHTVVIPRQAIEWGYENLIQGDRLGRLIAEFYFIYQDNRISNFYARSPKERYDSITEIFPNIHNRVPQHMIASYLGITPVHLSRLKRKGIKSKQMLTK